MPAMMQMITGGWVAGAIGTAAELGIADALGAGAGSAGEVAAKIKGGGHAPSVYRLMRFLACVGVLRQTGEGESAARFELTSMGQLLRAEGPGRPSVRDAAVFFKSHHCQRPWEEAAYSVRTGEKSFDKMFGMDCWKWYQQHPEDSEVFNRAMSALSSSMHAAAVEAYDFAGAGIGTICDIGGGHGHLLAQMLTKNAGMKGILYDLAHVVAGSAAMFQKFGVTARARAEAGSFLERVPAADAYTMSHILHDWDDAHCLTILKNCRAAVNAGAAGGGRVLVLDAVVGAPNEPDFGKLLDLEMLLVPGGRERTAEEFGSLLGAAGWRVTRIIPTKSSVAIVEGVAA
jgi:hypothetical protein